MNTCSYLRKVALYNPERVALIFGSEQVSYGEFYVRALAVGGSLLALGCKPGDRVAFCLANHPRILEVIYGCFAAGLVVVPVNARLHPKEMAYIASNSGARVLVHGAEYQAGIVEDLASFPTVEFRFCPDAVSGAMPYADLLDASKALLTPTDVEPTDPAWLFYTSGTTGKPKGATWSHRTISVMSMNYLADLHNIQPGEKVLHCAPLSHGSGIVALPAIARGATQIIFDKASFAPRALFEMVQQHRVEHIAFMAPTMIVKMLEDFVPGAYDLSSLKAICYGGAPIYVEHLRAAIAAFGPIFTQLYGQGEAPITISGLRASEHLPLIESGDKRIGSAGTIRTDVEVRIVDESGQEQPPGQIGEITVRGDVVMLGYWNNPAATAEAIRDGWLHTGDIGMLDDKGYLFLLDRSKDLIITGGNNVYPREVEEVIVQHPAVANVVVLGVPDAYWGEAVHAVVIREPGFEVSAEEIIHYCGQHLAGYKKPKGVDFVSEFPVSGYGKVLKRELRERYWKDHEGRIGGGALKKNVQA
ncbi:MAG: class I adenylate-forming enzyme family protein [Panacagrimonas sp.]